MSVCVYGYNCVFVYVYIRMRVSFFISELVYVCISVGVYLNRVRCCCLGVCISVCLYICICVYLYFRIFVYLCTRYRFISVYL